MRIYSKNSLCHIEKCLLLLVNIHVLSGEDNADDLYAWFRKNSAAVWGVIRYLLRPCANSVHFLSARRWLPALPVALCSGFATRGTFCQQAHWQSRYWHAGGIVVRLDL